VPQRPDRQGSGAEPSNSGPVAKPMEQRLERWYERLSLARAVATIVAVALVLVLAAGLLVRIVEPETFPRIGLAYWWAVTTVTTVGYGDVVPATPAGRLVAATLMLTGLSLIPALTSVVVTALLSKRRQADREAVEATLERLEAGLRRLEETG
jgi:voltage-gated potassium channel